MATILRDKLLLSENIHSHPNWTEKEPSGFGLEEHTLKNSDRAMADFAVKYFSKAMFKVYQFRNQ